MTTAKKMWYAGKQRWGCVESIHDSGFSVSFHSCGAAARFDPDGNGNPTKCGRHSQAAQAKRDAIRNLRYAEYEAEQNRRANMKKLRDEQLTIIRQIAAGHNDPRALCLEYLNRWEGANE
jgi:hypothetical protein